MQPETELCFRTIIGMLQTVLVTQQQVDWPMAESHYFRDLQTEQDDPLLAGLGLPVRRNNRRRPNCPALPWVVIHEPLREKVVHVVTVIAAPTPPIVQFPVA